MQDSAVVPSASSSPPIDINRELNSKNRELMEVDARLSTILENIGDGVVVVNTNGQVIFTNKQVELMTGYPGANLHGKYFHQTIRLIDDKGNEVPPEQNPIRNALFSNTKIICNDYFYVKSDNSKFAAAIIATPIHLGNNIIGAVNTFRDVTHERDIDRMKTEFISLASHQLRTPLSAMKWFSEILIDGDTGELNTEQKEMVQNIYNSNERMIELVNTLLNISRIESGRIIIDPKPTNLKKLIDEVVLELRPKLDAKKHTLVVSVHDELPEFMLDAKLVRHVYMNLLTNAIKYTPENGQIMVLISKSGNEIISQISDNGYGIPNEQQEKVFSKFFRAKNIISVETDGTGLGLYLTKAIVDSSGGKIWFESAEKKGTTFWFILPLQGTVKKEGEVSIDT
jgi:PAS domain S-box-containing protein